MHSACTHAHCLHPARPAAEVVPGPRPALGAARTLAAAAPTCALGAALGRGPGPLGDLVVPHYVIVSIAIVSIARRPRGAALCRNQGGSAFGQHAGSPEPALCVRACLMLPQASASLGQSAGWAAPAGNIGLVFDTGAAVHGARASTATAAAGAPPRLRRHRLRARGVPRP